jgi:hypothetical protein
MKEQQQNQALGASETTRFFWYPDFVSGECRRRWLDAKRDAHDA